MKTHSPKTISPHINALRVAALLVASLIFGLSAAPAYAGNNYGAIAVSPSTKALGWSYNYKSKAYAKSVALAHCRKHASDCRIANWFRNSCGAIAFGKKGGWGADWGRSIKQAKWKAVKRCRKHDYGCKAVRWVCTDR
ncbi:MAG: hypothetical protein DHS20C08_06090 [Rhodomicrobium sp.]|nr:MAG: hypothetical protein DHS20C08_06090 [Rhodomicrobium sp.]